MKEKFNVTGMTCSACSSRVDKCVARLAGVESQTVNLLTASMVVEYDDAVLSVGEIISAVENAGYGASLAGENKNASEKEEKSEKATAGFKLRMWVSFGFLIPLMYISMGHMVGLPVPSFLVGVENAVSFAFIQFLLCLPICYVNRVYYIGGFKSLFKGSPNMDSLIAVGSASALFYGIFAIFRMSFGLGSGNLAIVELYHSDLYFESASMILVLISLGKYFEARSKGKTSEALEKLIGMAPSHATVLVDGEERKVDIASVVVGSIVVIKAGESVPCDGIVEKGDCFCDESAITGESFPVEKTVGDEVVSSSVCKSGYVLVRATRVGGDTAFAQIVRLVEEASATKAPIAKIADKIAGVFVPCVMGISLVCGVVWLLCGAEFEFALARMITVLVVSCPCALGLATPVAIMVGTGKGAENGVLVRSGEALEVAHSVDTVVLDKTGTITEGKPSVTDVFDYLGEGGKFLSVALGLEEKSEHPLGVAVTGFVRGKGISPCEMGNFSAEMGKGVSGEHGGVLYFAGNAKFMAEKGIDISSCESEIDRLAGEGKVPLIFAGGGKVIGIVAVADKIKATSAVAIERFKEMGIKVVMLTGDNQKTANYIGKDLQLDEIIAEVLPSDKERVVRELQESGRVVAMVGDGINDSPALMRADVGIAIGAGADIASQSADIILVKSDLLDAVTAVKLSKSVIRNIKQNLFWAFFYNCLGIPLAAGAFFPVFGLVLSPMFGAGAMSCSSLFVVSNALRLKLFKAEKAEIKNVEVNKEEINAEVMDDDSQENMEEKIMTTIKIDGMMCMHCVAHVKKALEAVGGVSAVEVSLEDKSAKVEGTASVDVLSSAVVEAGYTVVSAE